MCKPHAICAVLFGPLWQVVCSKTTLPWGAIKSRGSGNYAKNWWAEAADRPTSWGNNDECTFITMKDGKRRGKEGHLRL